MSIYNYRVRNNKGGVESGSIEAENEEAALSKLKSTGLFIIELNKLKESKGKNLNISLNLFNRITLRDLAIFNLFRVVLNRITGSIS